MLTRIEPRGELCRCAVVVAHIDTNRCRIASHTSAVEHLKPTSWLTPAVLAYLGLPYLAETLLGGPMRARWVSLLPPAPWVVTVVTL